MNDMAEVEVETLLSLARRVQRLLPCWQCPEKFFIERSEIAAELRRIGSGECARRAEDPTGAGVMTA
jgi:hypothetical protein